MNKEGEVEGEVDRRTGDCLKLENLEGQEIRYLLPNWLGRVFASKELSRSTHITSTKVEPGTARLGALVLDQNPRNVYNFYLETRETHKPLRVLPRFPCDLMSYKIFVVKMKYLTKTASCHGKLVRARTNDIKGVR